MKFHWNTRYTQVTALMLCFSLVTTVTVIDSRANKSDCDVTGERTAGIVSAINGMGSDALSSANVEDADVTVVATAKETAQNEWSNRLMANVEEFLYVRATADAEGEIVGKMYRGDVAEILSETEVWYEILSGNVKGFVSAEYCVTGEDAYALAKEVCVTYATAKEGGIRIRTAADANAGIITVLAMGEQVEVDLQATPTDGWVAVKKSGVTGYVSSEYVTVAMDMGTAITIEEEQAILAKKKAEEEAAAAAAAARQAQRTQNAAVAASYDDVTLLAALIQCEAGNECYEGKVSVGAVVVNRVRSGGYPGSVYGVIFQSGQFTPAARGSVTSVAASGPSASCMQAAQEALAGVDYTGGALSFRPARSGRGGVVIGNHVFF